MVEAAIRLNEKSSLSERLLGRSVSALQFGVLGVGFLLVLAVGLLGGQYFLYIGALVAIYAIAVIALDLISGHGGQFSFGHNAFLGIGSYSTAYLTVRQHWDPLAALLVGVVLALVTSFIVGYPTLRLRGIYLVTATMALGLASSALAGSLDGITGGYTGIAGIPAFRIGGFIFKGAGPVYWLSWALLACSLALVTRLVNSRFGLALRTVAMDHDVAQSLGINPHRYKLAAFCISAAMTSVAGSLLVHLLTIASPENMSFTVQVSMFTMLFIGGLGNDLGIIAGSAIVVILPQALTILKDLFPIIFGVAMLFILVLRPTGLLAPSASGTDAAELLGRLLSGRSRE